MKRSLLLVIIMAMFILPIGLSEAHPGKTDASGGHICKTNCAKWGLKDGEYHIHKDGKIIRPNQSKPAPASQPKPQAVPATKQAPAPSVPVAPGTNDLKVYFLDVGQGDATYIKTANGDNILIDGGNTDKGDLMVKYLKDLKVDDIEVLIMTHPDADHIGGLNKVMQNFKVKSVYAPKVAHTTDTYVNLLKQIKGQGLSIKATVAGTTIPLQGVTARFVAPVSTYDKELNEWSAVLHLAYGTTSFLFTGDAEHKSEADMLKIKQVVKADVLKVGHHGSDSSTTPAFLKAVAPKYAVISSGKENKYGHPTQGTLKKLQGAGITTYRTDQKGTVIVISNGKTITWKTAR
ncbi:MBL fold metallo-hydrolase [Brevibacillus laterosporus]|nr:MBL fold metallo-hydrolase [Brevibacillus laterosporus]TPG69331.1 MBL fold metallo-hydrolase [Brevibacillus laterosporus]